MDLEIVPFPSEWKLKIQVCDKPLWNFVSILLSCCCGCIGCNMNTPVNGFLNPIDVCLIWHILLQYVNSVCEMSIIFSPCYVCAVWKFVLFLRSQFFFQVTTRWFVVCLCKCTESFDSLTLASIDCSQSEHVTLFHGSSSSGNVILCFAFYHSPIAIYCRMR